MAKAFSELVITGNFTLVKGFLLGFLCARKSTAKYFFHRKAGTIRRDSFTGLIKELMDFQSDVYLCLENSEVSDFKYAIEQACPRIGLSIKQIREIKSSEFKFDFELFNPDDGRECKKILDEAQQVVEIENFEPEEIWNRGIDLGYRHEGAHVYTYKGKGIVRGDVDNVIDVFLKCKRSQFSNFARCDEVILNFEDKKESGVSKE